MDRHAVTTTIPATHPDEDIRKVVVAFVLAVALYLGIGVSTTVAEVAAAEHTTAQVALLEEG